MDPLCTLVESIGLCKSSNLIGAIISDPTQAVEVAMDTGTALMMGPRHGVAELLRQLGGSCQLGAPVFRCHQSPRNMENPTTQNKIIKIKVGLRCLIGHWEAIICVRGCFDGELHLEALAQRNHGSIDQVH